ncbi:hypothetical protein [Paenibacillus sp. ATY16]|nr:hypothetical protein [Paenibacillus sp. ATY16]
MDANSGHSEAGKPDCSLNGGLALGQTYNPDFLLSLIGHSLF